MKELGEYIDKAATLAATDLERKRVDTWKKGVWEYMKTGQDQLPCFTQRWNFEGFL